MIKAIANPKTNVIDRIYRMIDKFVYRRGRKPIGIIVGAQDYLEMRAFLMDLESSEYFRSRQLSEFAGFPIRVIDQVRCLQCEIEPSDSVYHTLTEIIDKGVHPQ